MITHRLFDKRFKEAPPASIEILQLTGKHVLHLPTNQFAVVRWQFADSLGICFGETNTYKQVKLPEIKVLENQ